MKQFLLAGMALIIFSLSYAQNTSDFEASKGTWNFPVTNIESIDTTSSDCSGGQNNSLILTLKCACPQIVSSIQSGFVQVVFEVVGTYIVIVKTGDYFFVYEGLSYLTVHKGDLLKKGSPIGTLALGDSKETYDLTLMLFKKAKNINVNRWFDWKVLKSNSFQHLNFEYPHKKRG